MNIPLTLSERTRAEVKPETYQLLQHISGDAATRETQLTHVLFIKDSVTAAARQPDLTQQERMAIGSDRSAVVLFEHQLCSFHTTQAGGQYVS